MKRGDTNTFAHMIYFRNIWFLKINLFILLFKKNILDIFLKIDGQHNLYSYLIKVIFLMLMELNLHNFTLFHLRQKFRPFI